MVIAASPAFRKPHAPALKSWCGGLPRLGLERLQHGSANQVQHSALADPLRALSRSTDAVWSTTKRCAWDSNAFMELVNRGGKQEPQIGNGPVPC